MAAAGSGVGGGQAAAGVGHPSLTSTTATTTTSIPQYRDAASAELVLRQSVAATPGDGVVWHELGYCLFLNGKPADALAALQRSISLLKPPQVADVFYTLGLLYEYQGAPPAMEAFRQAIACNPTKFDIPETWLRMAMLMRASGMYVDAVKMFQRVLQSPPAPVTQADIMFHMGYTLELQGNLHLAAEAYQQVVNLKPDCTRALIQLGSVQVNMRDPRAAATLQVATRLRPESFPAWYLFGRALAQSGQPGPAFQALRSAAAADPKQSIVWNAIGSLYYELGQDADALEAFKFAVQIEATSAQLWYNMSIIYRAMQQPDNASTAFQRAIECGLPMQMIEDAARGGRPVLMGGSPNFAALQQAAAAAAGMGPVSGAPASSVYSTMFSTLASGGAASPATGSAGGDGGLSGLAAAAAAAAVLPTADHMPGTSAASLSLPHTAATASAVEHSMFPPPAVPTVSTPSAAAASDDRAALRSRGGRASAQPPDDDAADMSGKRQRT